MDTFECIKSRRSVRKFTNKVVSDSVLEKIISAGLHAPSSRDCQPWHVIVVKDELTRMSLARLKSEDNQEHIMSAPLSLVLCVDTNKSPNSFVEDGVCAAENMLLAIHDLGLGTVYVSAGSKTDPEVSNEIRSILGVPKTIVPLVILPLGYPDKNEKKEEKKIVEIEKVIHYDHW